LFDLLFSNGSCWHRALIPTGENSMKMGSWQLIENGTANPTDDLVEVWCKDRDETFADIHIQVSRSIELSPNMIILGYTKEIETISTRERLSTKRVSARIRLDLHVIGSSNNAPDKICR
jgi:hypothetical protein